MSGPSERTKLQVSGAEFAGLYLSEEVLRNILSDCLEKRIDLHTSLMSHAEAYVDVIEEVGQASRKHEVDLELDNIKIWFVAMPIIFVSISLAYVQSRPGWLGLSVFSWIIANHLYQFFGNTAGKKRKIQLGYLQFDPNKVREELENYIRKQESTLMLFTDRKDRILKCQKTSE